MRKVPRLPQFIHVMEDKLRIADWTSALNGILVVFDVRSVCFYLAAADFPLVRLSLL